MQNSRFPIYMCRKVPIVLIEKPRIYSGVFLSCLVVSAKNENHSSLPETKKNKPKQNDAFKLDLDFHLHLAFCTLLQSLWTCKLSHTLCCFDLPDPSHRNLVSFSFVVSKKLNGLRCMSDAGGGSGQEDVISQSRHMPAGRQ